MRLLLTYLVLSLTAVLFVSAQQAQLVVVRAGDKFQDIAALRWGNVVRVCPEKYPTGFSICCRGPGVRGPVGIAAHGGRVRWEGRAPFHIAGDLDIGRLTRIFPWTGYKALCNRNKPCYLRMWCTYGKLSGGRGSTVKPLIIQPWGCSKWGHH